MNLFTSVYKAAFGSTEPAKERGPTLTGSFFLHRKAGLRNPRECLLINGVLSIRDHGNFTHVLVVEPALEEGQEELLDDDSSTTGREYTCPLSSALRLRGPDLKDLSDLGLQYAITWSASEGDKNSDTSERYEFMCPDDTEGIQEFERHLWNCLYESETKSPAKASEVERWRKSETGLFRYSSEEESSEEEDEEDEVEDAREEPEEEGSDAELANELMTKATVSDKGKGKAKEKDVGSKDDLPPLPAAQPPDDAKIIQQFVGDVFQYVGPEFKPRDHGSSCHFLAKKGVVYFVIYSGEMTTRGKPLVSVSLTEEDDADSWTFNDTANFVSFNVKGEVTIGIIFKKEDFERVREVFVGCMFNYKNGPGQWEKLKGTEQAYLKESYVDVLMEEEDSEESQEEDQVEDNDEESKLAPV
ncbi:hypothetical protein BT69DRAFT_456728 [Atractiella rhizophila]|nr:hypothetical protein BT69DRAFT_456728 [Atractiella rhizophila]